MSAWRIGADIGGTFTDLVALSDDGRLERAKVLTQHRAYADAITGGLRERLSEADLAAVARVTHGTTVATNAILEQQAPNIGLVTTAGFRDVLEIRRGRRPALYDLDWRPPAPLVARDLRIEVRERVASDGSVVLALDEDDLSRCVAALAERDVAAVAVCLLNSFANPGHEELVVAALRRELPGVKVTASSAIVPEIREFERTSTTVVNAFLLPIVEEYLRTLDASLERIGVRCPLEIMQSDGTTASVGATAERPFLIIESGPAAGVVAAARLSEELGRTSVIAFDMGGTTAKASLVEDHRVGLTEELEVGDSLTRGGGLLRGAGHAVRSPCVDLTEVGSGGGSIAWVDGGGALRVGPASAGSDPGPACYGGGGTEPTVADAHVVLGYLNPTAIAGGTKPIHAELAHEAVGRLAEALDLGVLDAAYGIYTVATAQMRRAVRAVSVERGRDPRGFSLVAFGGAGGLHAAALAAELEMAEVIVPIAPGLFSSLGLLLSDLATTRVASHRAIVGDESAAALRERVTRLADEASSALRAEHPSIAQVSVETAAALRYVGQSSSLTLPFDPAAAADDLLAAFHDEHRRVYGQAAEGEQVETVLLRARAVAPARKPSFATIAAGYDAGSEPAEASRACYFGPVDGTRTTPIVSRAALRAGPARGPLVVEEFDTTIVVPPGFTAVVDATGSVVLTPDRDPEPGS